MDSNTKKAKPYEYDELMFDRGYGQGPHGGHLAKAL